MSSTVLVAIIGASGSGLTSVAKELEGVGYNIIKSYTTRKPRYEGEWGYNFLKGKVSDNGKDVITDCGVFSRAQMVTYFEGYENGGNYFATADQVASGRVNVLTVTPEGANQAKRFYEGSNVKVLTLYLQVDEQIRAERLVRRVENGYCITPKDNPTVWSRIRPDRELFEVVEADYTINANYNIDRVVNKIISLVECTTIRKDDSHG